MNNASDVLGLTPEMRHKVWAQAIERIDRYFEEVSAGAIGPESLDPSPLRRTLEEFTFEQPCSPIRALDFAVEGLLKYQLHTPHQRYFGLFNPAPSTMGIIADALVAAFNPQLAAWSHSPFAVEVEQYLIRTFGAMLGFGEGVEGTFASGGAEANLTAVICALVRGFPEFADEGVRAIAGRPLLYVSEHAHHSFLKAARCCGLGSNAVRQVPLAHQRLTMDVKALKEMISRDRNEGFVPFMAVATAGTTCAGAFDDIESITKVCDDQQLWCHVDAAWGGAAALLPEFEGCLAGLGRADSMTFDAHKFLSVPMGAGLFLTRTKNILGQAFAVTTDYMPASITEFDTVDPYNTSIQWSRRFIGLKVFLSLAVAGKAGYVEVIRQQSGLGQHLRRRLQETGWSIVNDTPVPVVCFVNSQHKDPGQLERIAQRVVESQSAWISTVKLPALALRACVTNYRTTVEDVEQLVTALNHASEEIKNEKMNNSPSES